MRLHAALVATVLTLAGAGSAHAWWTRDPGGSPVCTAPGDQLRPVALADGQGGSFFVWVDVRSGSYDLYAQHVSSIGNPLWAPNGVPVCTAAGLQEAPSLCPDGEGGIVVAWEDGRGANYDIYAQRLNAAGAPVWAVNGVLVNGAIGDQISPQIATDGLHGAIVTWTDYRSGSASDIWCQRVDSTGTRMWFPNGNGIVVTSGDQDTPSVIPFGAGGILCVWVDRRVAGNYDLYYRRVNSSGVPQGPANGLPLCNAPGDQLAPALTSDGLGGAFVAWADARQSQIDVYAQRIDPTGVVMWAANGDTVCGAIYDQQYPSIVADGKGGAFVSWEDQRSLIEDLYAQHLDGSGNRTWNPNGAPVCTAAGAQTAPQMVADTLGGAIVVWQDARSGSFDVYAQHLTGSGASLWGSGGMPVCTAPDQQVLPAIVTDGVGGAIAVWADNRSLETDIWSQRVLQWGGLGPEAPVITSVADKPNDDGGFVRVSWNAGFYDGGPLPIVDHYLVQRQAFDGSWSAIDTVLADGGPAYVHDEPSIADSVPGHPTPRTVLRIDACDPTGAQVWSSAADSGFSQDNRNPTMPQGLVASFAGGLVTLTWQPNHEADLAGYHVYAGVGSTFGLDPSTLRAFVASPAWSGPAAATTVFKVTAVDVHGNESDPAFAQAEPSLAVGAAVYFTAFSPNPASGTCSVRCGLSREGRVTMALYDARGRRVRLLDAGVLGPGEHTLRWDGRDDAGHDTAPGMYFARVRLEGRDFTQRIVRVR